MVFFSSPPDWRDKLRDASFRGVPFSVEDDEGEFGRRVQVHEYPNRDKPFTEDLGRAARRLTINAYLVGSDYSDQRDRLIAAIETPGPGTLVHPHYGEMKGSVDGNVKVSHSRQEGRMCRVSFQFVESGELSFPVAGAATEKKLEESTGLFDGAIEDMFSDFSLDGITDFLQSDIVKDATAMLDTVIDTFEMIDDGVTAAMRLLQGDLSVILMPPSPANDFVRTLQKAWRAGDRLSGNSSDLVTMVKTFSGITLDRGLAPRGTWTNSRSTWSSDSRSTSINKQLSNQIAAVIRATAISAASETVTLLPQPKNTAALDSVAGDSDIINISHPSLYAAGQVMEKKSPPTWDELNEVRSSLNVAIDLEQTRISDDMLFQRISIMRTDINEDISRRLAQVERTVLRTPVDVMPALVLAAQWYDDASRESDILSRNNINHPGFVPVNALRVPVK